MEVVRVREFLAPNGEWNQDKLMEHVLEDVARKIVTSKPPSLTLSPNVPYQALTLSSDFTIASASSGDFTIASTYENLWTQSTNEAVQTSGVWNTAWKWHSPQRIRMFLLYCLHG